MLTGTIPSNETRSLIGEIGLEGTSPGTNTSGIPSQFGGYNESGVSYVPSTLNFNWTARGILDDATLHALDNEPLFKNVNKRINFRTNQVYYEGIGTRIYMASQPWIEPRVPSLHSALTTGRLALRNTTYGPGVNPYILRHNDVVEIYMENPQIWPHPMHLHVSTGTMVLSSSSAN